MSNILTRMHRPAAAALASALVLNLSACGGLASNRTLYPVHQPVVSHTSYALDLTVTPDGLSPAEQTRLSGWFDAMGLRYGDKVSVDDPLGNAAARGAVDAIIGKRGLLANAQPPALQAPLNAGTLRVTLTRASAVVPGCPDWSANSESNFQNATNPNFGCANNANLAAMVANPDDLLHGAQSSSNTVATSNKAISTYREAKPTGEGGLKQSSSKGS